MEQKNKQTEEEETNSYKEEQKRKRKRSARFFKNIQQGITYKDDRNTAYISPNKGGTLKRAIPKTLGRRQQRKLGLLPRKGGKR